MTEHQVLASEVSAPRDCADVDNDLAKKADQSAREKRFCHIQGQTVGGGKLFDILFVFFFINITHMERSFRKMIERR